MFLYLSDETAQPGRASYAILEPGESAAREYSLTSMCMIGHGIGAEPQANFSACYRPGKIKNTMRVTYITDWNKLTRRESNSVAIELSEPDLSMHSDFRNAPQRPSGEPAEVRPQKN